MRVGGCWGKGIVVCELIVRRGRGRWEGGAGGGTKMESTRRGNNHKEANERTLVHVRTVHRSYSQARKHKIYSGKNDTLNR